MDLKEPGSPSAMANEPMVVDSGGKKSHRRKASGNRGSVKGKNKVYAPYRENDTLTHISQKVTRSPAKIRIAASVKN